MECCKKLIRLRKQRGLTQQELAEAVDVSRQAISKWELGTASPTVESLRSLSLFYGVPVDLLLDDELNLPDPSEVTPKEPPQQNKGSSAEENPLGNQKGNSGSEKVGDRSCCHRGRSCVGSCGLHGGYSPGRK